MPTLELPSQTAPEGTAPAAAGVGAPPQSDIGLNDRALDDGALDGLLESGFDPGRPTGDWLELWLSAIVPGTVSPATLDGYRHVVRRDVLPYVGTVPLGQLGPQHVLAMMRRLQARGLAPRTIAYARALLRRALAQAVRRLAGSGRRRGSSSSRSEALLRSRPDERQRRRSGRRWPCTRRW